MSKAVRSLGISAKATRLVVLDMAGTTVDEGGIVYDTLKGALRQGGITFSEEEFNRFHGSNKSEVVDHFVLKSFPKSEHRQRADAIMTDFTAGITKAYFMPNTSIKAVPGAIDFFQRAREAGILVALNTGYPRDIADRLIDQMGFRDHIDASIVANEAGAGRPCPYMIFDLMRKLKVHNVAHVAKIGDTANDMQEGRNAGLPKVIGVLTGADTSDTLADAGASDVFTSVAEIPILP